MSFLDQISVLVLTYNEAPNIGRTLEALRAFQDVVVLDSGSSDGTVAIVASFPNVRLATRSFDTHSAQWNHGLTSCGIDRPWVLALDADYVVPPAFVEEIARLVPDSSISGFRAAFHYCIKGRPLSGTLYPPGVVLYRRARAHYVQSGHTQRIVVDGAIGILAARIDHDDRKPLERWLMAQQRYARLEAEHLLATPRAQLRRIDRLRLWGWAAPILVLVYVLIWKRCLFNGWPGWLYALQRMVAEGIIALMIIEQQLRAPLLSSRMGSPGADFSAASSPSKPLSGNSRPRGPEAGAG